MKKEETKSFSKFWKPTEKDDILLFKGHFDTYEYDKHAHEEYTISLIHDGNMKGFLNGFSHNFSQSTVLTINPDEIHACKTNSDLGYTYNSIYFRASFLNDIANEHGIRTPLYFKKNTLNDKGLYQKLSALVALNEIGISSKIEFESVLIDVLEQMFQLNHFQRNVLFANNKERLISRAKEFINDNYALDLRLEDIAKELNISKYHFLRIFKSYTHISPHSYLMNRRIEKAKIFLQKGTSIINTAYDCGFNDQSHLHRRFKAIMGITPKQYQNFFK
jgi:AraC-like DNA-binding protein